MILDTKKPSHLAVLLGAALATGAGGAGAMKLAAEAPPFAPVAIHILGEPGARRYQVDVASGKQHRMVLCSTKGEAHVDDVAASDSFAAICKAASAAGVELERAVSAASDALR